MCRIVLNYLQAQCCQLLFHNRFFFYKVLVSWFISLEGFNNNVDKYIFIALKDENSDIKSFINERCKILNIKNYKIIILDKLTDGQATTAMLAKEYWNENGVYSYTSGGYERFEPD